MRQRSVLSRHYRLFQPVNRFSVNAYLRIIVLVVVPVVRISLSPNEVKVPEFDTLAALPNSFDPPRNNVFPAAIVIEEPG